MGWSLNGLHDKKEASSITLASAQERIIKLEELLLRVTAFIQEEYEISGMQAHHDGHHIETTARPLWDDIWTELKGY